MRTGSISLVGPHQAFLLSGVSTEEAEVEIVEMAIEEVAESSDEVDGKKGPQWSDAFAASFPARRLSLAFQPRGSTCAAFVKVGNCACWACMASEDGLRNRELILYGAMVMVIPLRVRCS